MKNKIKADKTMVWIDGEVVKCESEESAEALRNYCISCVLCGMPILPERSNNPWPLTDSEEQRCCKACNWALVIPARGKGIKDMYTLKGHIVNNKFYPATKEGQA